MPRLKPGTVLLREDQGERLTLTVVPTGYLWRETAYGSLLQFSSARTKAARSAAIRAAGARLLFLPPYSPDLNPIEQVFAKLKTLIRKAEERTVDGLWRRIGGSLEAFTPRECANYLRNAGYAST